MKKNHTQTNINTIQACILKGDLTEGFLRYWIGGPIFGGAYTWRGLFSEFYGTLFNNCSPKVQLILLNNPRDEVEGIIQQY